MNVYERLLDRYQRRENLSWDEELPPPEVQAVAADLPAGRALDLGCGFGRAAIYLAQLGWQVDGVDFIEIAITEARQRAESAGVNARFHVAPVTAMPFLTGPYDLAVDVGCLHALDETGLLAYKGELQRLLRPGATYLLFARLREGDPAEQGKPGIEEATLQTLFADTFVVERVEIGRTRLADASEWASGWFWFRKRTPSASG